MEGEGSGIELPEAQDRTADAAATKPRAADRVAGVVHDLAVARALEERRLGRCPSDEGQGSGVQACDLGGLQLRSGQVREAGPEATIKARVADDQGLKHGTAGGGGGPRGPHEDGAAGGEGQQVLFDEVALVAAIPQAGERDGLHDPVGNEDERPLRGDEREERTHELVVEASRGSAHDFQRGSSLDRRPVGRNQARKLRGRQDTLYGMESLSRQRPRRTAESSRRT